MTKVVAMEEDVSNIPNVTQFHMNQGKTNSEAMPPTRRIFGKLSRNPPRYHRYAKNMMKKKTLSSRASIIRPPTTPVAASRSRESFSETLIAERTNSDIKKSDRGVSSPLIIS